MPSSSRDAPLTRDEILASAVGIADADGLDAVSMRRLGESVGVRAMSLYHHVADKDDLVAGMLEAVSSEMDRAADAVDWRDGLERQARSMHEALLRHRWAPPVWTAGSSFGPDRTDFADAVLGGLRRQGFSAYASHRAFHAINNHVLGHAMQAVSFPVEAEELPSLAATFLTELGDAAPNLAEHVRLHVDGVLDDPDNFTWTLELILDGLAPLRDT